MSQSTNQSGKKISLKYYLQKHKTIPEKSFTHTALGEPPKSYPGSYCIEDDDLESFFETYTNTVFKHDIPAHLTERHRDVSPILIDLDFRHKPDLSGSSTPRKYTKQFIIDFIQQYLNIVDELIDVEDEKKVAFVLEKDTPVVPQGKNIVKDGIHVIFPYIVTTPKLQYIWRYKSIINEKINELVDTLNVTNSIDDIFDIAVIEKNNWQIMK